MTGDLQNYLLDTLLWTAVLIGFVLVARRPVAKIFGPRAAYALWALPFLRLILPPLVLPAWLAPAPQTEVTSTYSVILAEAVPVAIQQTAAPFDWALLALVIWLVGVAVFLAIRFRSYFELRRELLERATPVGEAGKVRLVETKYTRSPIAFGVFDKVVALPVGFMALTNRDKRDLALEHEFAHHKAGDLMANFAVQPLFALHWFNPLGWYGWRAMRSDQEAACDARVMAACGDADRATYASVIASFAAGPNIALAASMACPVIGEKSIIHRLRSLTMNDISPRRRMAGRALMGAAMLALPLTASISYAESMNAPAAPVAPAAPNAALPVAPPAPPAPPMAMSLLSADDAPEVSDKDDREANVFIIKMEVTDENGEKTEKVIERRRTMSISSDGEKMSAEEREAMMKMLHEELSEMEIDLHEATEEMRVAVIEMKGADGDTKVEMECTNGDGSGEWKGEDGKRVIRICKSQIMASALSGLKEARDSISQNKDMDPEIRDEVVKALDEKISNWGQEG